MIIGAVFVASATVYLLAKLIVWSCEVRNFEIFQARWCVPHAAT
jgi:hypothetical protein